MIHNELPVAIGRIAELRAALFSFRETRPTHHVYLLLDNACPMAADHPLHPSQLMLRPVARRVARLPGPAGADQWQPSLLMFYEAGENGYLDEELLELSLATACERHASINGAYVAAWIGSELAPDQLAARLAKRCEQFDVLQGRSRRMPLYEPHRMALLLDESEGADFAHGFLSGLPFWAFVDGAGALRTLTVAGSDAGTPRSAARMSLRTCAAQQRVSLARLALLALVKANAIIPAQIERKLDALLVAADQQRLSHPEDIIFFALNGLSLSPQWHLHPTAKHCIARSVQEAAPLAGLMTELPDALLHEIGSYRPD